MDQKKKTKKQQENNLSVLFGDIIVFPNVILFTFLITLILVIKVPVGIKVGLILFSIALTMFIGVDRNEK